MHLAWSAAAILEVDDLDDLLSIVPILHHQRLWPDPREDRPGTESNTIRYHWSCHARCARKGRLLVCAEDKAFPGDIILRGVHRLIVRVLGDKRD